MQFGYASRVASHESLRGRISARSNPADHTLEPPDRRGRAPARDDSLATRDCRTD
ncbi:MAG: hypothetical protein H0T58_10440 [Gemmatimonadales bacterium]|nr:hypothetical protein [Gemmatimonadales bacterium]